MDAPSNWSARAVRAMIEQVLDDSQSAPNRTQGIGDPFKIDVTFKPDEWFPPTATRGCWNCVGLQPNGHIGEFFRQSRDEAAAMIFTLLEYAIHYGDHDPRDVTIFAETVNLVYGA